MDSKEDPNRKPDDSEESDPSKRKPDESKKDPESSEKAESPDSPESKPGKSKNDVQDTQKSEVPATKSVTSKHASDDSFNRSTVRISVINPKRRFSSESNTTNPDEPSTPSRTSRPRHVYIANQSSVVLPSLASSYSFTKFKTVKDSVLSIVSAYGSGSGSLENLTFKSNSLLESIIHSLKLLFGTQVLAMPFAFSYSGWFVGIVSTFCISAVFAYSFYTTTRLMRAVRNAENEPNMTFPQVIEQALDDGPCLIRWLSRPSLYIVNIIHIIYRVANGAVVMLFMAQNLAQIFQDIDVLWSMRIWLIVVFVPTLLVALIPDLQRLTPFSVVGVVMNIIGVIFIIYFLAWDLPPIAQRKMTCTFNEFFLLCGILCFASGPLNNISLGLGWKNNDESSRTHVPLIAGAIISACMNALVGFLGYWKFGNESLPSITLNLPMEREFPHWVRVIFILTSFILYSVNVYIVLHIIMRHHVKVRLAKLRRRSRYQYLVRVMCVTLSLLIAEAMPRLGFLRSFLGIFPNIMIGFVFVPLAELSFYWPDELGRLKWVAIKNICIVLIGLVLLCVGLLINFNYLLHSLIKYEEGYDFLPCNPNSTSGTLKIYCDRNG